MPRQRKYKYAYSFSSIDRYLKCPLSFKLSKIDKLKQEDSTALRLGRLLHEISADYVSHLVQQKRQTDLDALNRLLESKRTECSFSEFDELSKITNEFGSTHVYNFDYQDGFLTEQRLAFNLNWKLLNDFFDDSVFFRGVIDLMHFENDLLVITDYKTSRSVASQTEVDNDFQLDIYAYLANLIYPNVERMLVRLDFVRFSTYRQREIDINSLDSVKEKIMHYVDKIENTVEFEARVSSNCDFCNYASHCPKFKEMSKLNTNFELNSNEDALKLAEQLRLADAFRKHATAKLKQWIENNVPISVGDECLNYHDSIEKYFDNPVDIIKIMHKLGLSKEQIWPAITLTPAAVKKVLKQNNLYSQWDETIVPLIKEDKKSRFQFKKL